MGSRILADGLCGVSQIVFMNQPLAGAIFLLGITLYSPFMALACFIGAISANFTAEIGNRPASRIREGIYGFNGALLGLAMTVFLSHEMFLWIFLILGAGLTVLLYEIISNRIGIPPLTFPFVLLTWLIVKATDRVETGANHDTVYAMSYTSLVGIGQIFFLDSYLCGFILLGGMALFSIRFAFWAWIGALVGMLPTLWLIDQYLITSGFISLNTALCSIGFMRLIDETNKRLMIMLAFMTAIIYPFFHFILSFFELPTLTFPFIVSLWLCLAYYRSFHQKGDLTNVTVSKDI